MSPGDGAALAAGALLGTFLTFDIVATILHAWVGMGPLTRWVIRGLWWGLVRISGAVPRAGRHAVLGWSAPFLVPVVIFVWIGVGVFAFSFLYLPWMPSSFHTPDAVPDTNRFFDALYYSAVTLFTLGYGSVVPTSGASRALAMFEAAWGFSVVSLVTSYFVSFAGADRQQKALAESLFVQAGRSADPARLIARHLSFGGVPALAAEAVRIREALVRVWVDFQSYTSLFYMPTPRAESSCLRVIHVSRELAELLDLAVDAERAPELAGLGERSGLGAAVHQLQDALVGAVVRQTPPTGTGEAGDHRPAVDDWVPRLQARVEMLRAAGVPVRSTADVVADHRFARAGWEPALRAAAAALGEEWAAVTGADAPRPGDGAEVEAVPAGAGIPEPRRSMGDLAR